MLVALGLGLVLRLGMEPERWWFTGDEGVYHQVATTASTERAQEVIHKNAHPPLHYWILRLAAPWVHDPANLRLISLMAGLLGILAAGWLGWESATGGTRWGRVAGAWFGAVMVALAPGLIVQAATLRPYALCVFVLTAGLASLLRYLAGGRARWLLAFSLGLTVAVLLLYTSFLVALALGLLLLGARIAGRLSRKQFATLLAAGAPATVAMAWLLATHIVPQLLGSATHRRATGQWLHDHFAHNLFQALRLLHGAMTFTFSNTVKTFVQGAPVEAWLTDVQTSMLLMPLASPENRVLTPEPTFSGAHLDVLGRRIAVVKSWQLPEFPAPQNDPVEAALAWLEPVATRGDGRIGLVVGGWGSSAAYRLAATLRASGHATVVAVGDASLAAVIVTPAALRSWRAIQAARLAAMSRYHL
jgi:hypothetical protein